MRQPSDKNIRLWLTGLRLVAMTSNGLDDEGQAEMKIDCSRSTKTILARLGNADHLIRRLSHNWLITVVVIIKDLHGNYDTRHHLFLAKGQRINDTAEDVQPVLDRIRGEVNEKLIVDWGWIAEILPTKRFDKKQDEQRFFERAEQYLENWIINKHIEQERVA